MADASWTRGSGADDGWGPSTPVRSASAADRAPRRDTRSPSATAAQSSASNPTSRSSSSSADSRSSTSGAGRRRRPAGTPAPAALSSDAYAGSPWAPAGNRSAAGTTGTSSGSRPGGATLAADPFRSSLGAKAAGEPLDPYADDFREPTVSSSVSRGVAGDRRAAAQSAIARLRAAVPSANQRGLPAWGAVLLQIGVMVLGILVDAVRGQQLGSGFNIGIIVGAVLSILVVRRSGMFPVVVAPPIVYSLGAGISLYIRSSGLSDHSVLIDAATNWLVYGFPAIAAATAAVLIIAGIRLITRK